MSQITEAKLYEAFGLGAQAQEPAEPAAEPQVVDTESGAQVQEIAEPAAEETNLESNVSTEPAAGSADPEEPENKAVNDSGSQKNMQTPEERRANAARRRQQEQQAAVESAVAAARQQEQEKYTAQLNQVFARAGLVDSATGKPITNLQEFEQWYKGFTDAKLQQDLKSGKLSKDTIDQLISNHPAVKQAEQVISQLNTAQEQQRIAADKARIDDQLAKIAELNPGIKGLQDILQMPTAAAFRANVAKGMDFLDAYRLANMDAIAEDKAQRARQAAQTNERGKEHLVSTGNSRGAGAASVPPDQMRLYRMMNPRATDAQIQAHFNKYLSNQGG